jgi:hypothetical protein
MRHAIRMAGFVFLVLLIHCGSKNHFSPIVIHSNGHFLMSEDKPFFLLCDAARTLITRFDDKEVLSFFRDRREKGYNVILTMLSPDPSKADRGGRRPFMDNDPLRPNESYFNHVSRLTELAASENLYVGLIIGGPVADDPIFKRISTPEKSYAYGHRIAERLKKNTNLIWVLGQDCTGKEIDQWRALAEGIADAYSGVDQFDDNFGNGNACMTFYPPMGYSSSYWLQSEDWLDFNLFRPEYARDGRSSADSLAWRNWNQSPVKPVIDIGGWDKASGLHTLNQAREASIRSVFAGGCGVGFESGMDDTESMKNLLTLPESGSLRHLKNLMLSRPFFSRIPDPAMVEMDLSSPPSATRDSTGHYAFVYFDGPGKTQQILASRLSGNRLRAWWYSPADGRTHDMNGSKSERPFAEIEKTDWTFKSPASGRDWILVLDDASFPFPVPGKPLDEKRSLQADQ